MSGDIEAESLFFRGRRKCVKHTRLCDVGRRTTNATPLWDLVEMQLGMLVDSNCDDPQAHSAAQGDAVGDAGRLRLQCLLGDASRCEGAQSRTLTLRSTGTRVPDTVLCGAGGGGEQHHG